jgi:hypothetical protein
MLSQKNNEFTRVVISIRFNFVKPEVQYLNFTEYMLQNCSKKLQSFEVLFPFFGIVIYNFKKISGFFCRALVIFNPKFNFLTRSSGKFPGLHSVELRYQLRFNFVKSEVRYLNFGVCTSKCSGVYASEFKKKITEF